MGANLFYFLIVAEIYIKGVQVKIQTPIKNLKKKKIKNYKLLGEEREGRVENCHSNA
jgi:hypothetical protein